MKCPCKDCICLAICKNRVLLDRIAHCSTIKSYLFKGPGLLYRSDIAIRIREMSITLGVPSEN